MSTVQREGYDPEWMKYESSLPPGPMLPPGPGMGEVFCSLMIDNARTFPPPPEGVQSYDEKISDNVTVRVYQPPEHQSTTHSRPVVVFYAGGGWVTGNLDTEDHLCRTICGRADVVVVSVDYRKFPAIQFPENIQDSYDGFQWAYEHASDLRADISKYIAMGGSAGGGLAVSVVHKLIQNGHRDRISGLVPLASTNLQRTAVPAEYQHLHTSMTENSGEIPFVTATMSDGVYNLLGGNPPYNDESKHWFPVTMGVEGVKDFPPTWILDCEKDCMRDDGRVLQAEMEDAGLKVKREVVKGMPHYYWAFPVQAAAEDFRKRLLAGLKWVLYSQEDELSN